MNATTPLKLRQRVLPSRRRGVHARQRGVVLIFSLIILLILTIGAVALMRSMNNSLFGAGNLAFRRDLVNQSELAIATVLVQFESGGALVGQTTSNVQASNYSATILTTNPQGVPNALLNDATFATVGLVANDIQGATPDVVIRYVVDRLCAPGTVAPIASACVQAISAPPGGTVLQNGPVTPPSATVYRLSVRATQIGRNTQIFLQTTFSMPGS